MGILGVDMEVTALMTIAAYRNVGLGIITAISDELYGEVWKSSFKTRRLRRTGKIIVDAALKTIIRVGERGIEH